jgi:hypothetical protein
MVLADKMVDAKVIINYESERIEREAVMGYFI